MLSNVNFSAHFIKAARDNLEEQGDILLARSFSHQFHPAFNRRMSMNLKEPEQHLSKFFTKVSRAPLASK